MNDIGTKDRIVAQNKNFKIKIVTIIVYDLFLRILIKFFHEILVIIICMKIHSF